MLCLWRGIEREGRWEGARGCARRMKGWGGHTGRVVSCAREIKGVEITMWGFDCSVDTLRIECRSVDRIDNLKSGWDIIFVW